MALQYSSITVEPAPGYGVHNPGPSSTEGFAMTAGAKVFAPEKQLDYHLDVAAQSPAIVSVSVVTHRSDFFPKGSVVTIVQNRDDQAVNENVEEKITSRSARRAKENYYMVAITKPDETVKGQFPYRTVLGAAAEAFLGQGPNVPITLIDTKPLGVLAEAVSITEYTPTVIPVAVMGAIEAACDQNVQMWRNMFPGERVILRVSGVSRIILNATTPDGLYRLCAQVPGPDDLLRANDYGRKYRAALNNNPASRVSGFRHTSVLEQSVACRVITPPEQNGLVYVYLE